MHFEWLHSNWSLRLSGKDGPYSPTHLKVGFDEFEYGFVYRRVRADTTEDDELWTVGRVCLWPNALFTGDHFEWRVPIDDENTLSVGWFLDSVARRRALRAGAHPLLVLADQGPEDRPLDQQPRHEPGLHRLGRPGHDRGPDRRAPGRERPRRDHDAASKMVEQA